MAKGRWYYSDAIAAVRPELRTIRISAHPLLRHLLKMCRTSLNGPIDVTCCAARIAEVELKDHLTSNNSMSFHSSTIGGGRTPPPT
jgi:hypothetical protein